ncbi:MAG TPA: Ig-like domain-containing protein [Actinomycetota bacterium]|nr:Ig-like domain-containing protein [Actinomycetota bacterium]
MSNTLGGRRLIAFATLGLVLTAVLAVAPAPALGNGVLSGPAYPPPGGATVTSNSCTNAFGFSTPCEGQTPGRNLSYTVTNPGLFTHTYWGPSQLPQLSLDSAGAPGCTPGPTCSNSPVTIPFAAISGTTARWECANNCVGIQIFSGGGSSIQMVRARVLATVTSGPAWVLASSVSGLPNPANASAVLPVTGVGSFSINYKFEISTNSGSTWTPAIAYYDQSATNPAKHTYIAWGFGFYYNRPPVAANQSFTTNEDTAVGITLNASDIDGNDLHYSIGSPSNGTLSGTAPNLIYTPSLDYVGPDSFTYTATDGFATTGGTVSIEVAPVNDAPVAINQAITTDEDTPVTFTVSGTDTDTPPENLVYEVVGLPSNGTLDLTDMPTITYTPAQDFNGADSVTFDVFDGALHSSPLGLISITVNPVNDAPVATDSAVTTDEDTPLEITMQATDVDLDTLTYTVLSGPENGSFSPDPDGTSSITYVPNENFFGSDSFTFQVTDGLLDSQIATVSITVNAVNDAPVADAQELTTDEDTPLAITLTASDVDNELEDLSYSVVNGPTYGSLSGEGAELLYTPNADWNGTDSFTFVANDGELNSVEATVTIVVSPVNDAPVADDNISVETAEDNSVEIVLTGFDIDTDVENLAYSIVEGPAHGTIECSGTNCTYTPDADYNGPDSFTFKINDGELDSNVATVSINVTPVNDAPIAFDQTVLTNEDTATPIVLGGSDVDGDEIVFAIVDGPTHGTLDVLDGNTIVYTPFENYYGPDAFTFTVSDAEYTSNIATVSIDVAEVNDNPVAVGDGVSTEQYTPVTFDVLGNDTDVDGDVLTVVSASPGAHGTTTVNPDGTLTYSPSPTFKGEDTLTYSISDGRGGTAIGSVIITEIGCGEDGINTLDGTPAEGAASETIDRQVEPVIGMVDPDTAATVHAHNCTTVVSAENAIDELAGG